MSWAVSKLLGVTVFFSAKMRNASIELSRVLNLIRHLKYSAQCLAFIQKKKIITTYHVLGTVQNKHSLNVTIIISLAQYDSFI